jgi:hypothetical protein
VNPIEITRRDYRKVALDLNLPYLEVEVICSDSRQHRKRIETRVSSIDGLKLPPWQDVLDRDYVPWNTKSITLDTALISETEAVDKIVHELAGK